MAGSARSASLTCASTPCSSTCLPGQRLIAPAFAQRHGILIAAADALGVTVASAEPYQNDWQADPAPQPGPADSPVLASLLQIRQAGQSFEHLAQSVKARTSRPPAWANSSNC